MAAPSYASRWPVYAKQWDAMQRTRLTETTKAARRLIASKERYQAVEAKTGVPWYMVACIHYRESDADFTTQLAQGDPLDRKSTHVPAGLGPYRGADAWERAAVDILTIKKLDKVRDWRLEKILYHCEAYNGWGYFKHGIPSAYIWAGSSIARPGMYVADHVWSDTKIDPRLGCAPLIKTMAELDPTIELVRETAEDQPSPTPTLPLITVTVSPPGSARVRIIGAVED